MIESYNVERFDRVTHKQTKEIGFTSELLAFLAAYKITKDEITEVFERAGDENQTLETAMGEILQNRGGAPAAAVEQNAVEAEPASLPSSEATAE